MANLNDFQLIEKYLPQSVDKFFAHDSKSAILEKGSKWIDVNFKETGYVKIANMLLDGLSDYYQTQQNSQDFVNPALARPADPANYAAYAGNLGTGERDGFAIGNLSVTWEIFRLQWVRGKQFRIDYIANEETAGIIIGNALEEFHRLKVIPEVDLARFSFIASKAAVSLGNRVDLAVDTANAQTSGAYINALNGATGVIHRFNDAFESLFEMGVPEDEQVIFVSPTIMTLIRNTAELTKFITQGDYRSEAGLTFNVEKYMGRPIIEVPSDRFYTDAVLTQNGPRPASTSKVINFMVVSTKATVPVRKLEYDKIYGPELSGLAGFHGYIINYLLYHGIFVPKNKLPGIYVSVSNTDAAAKASVIRLHIESNNTAKTWKLEDYFTNPAGLRGTVVYKASSLGDLGATVSIDGTTVKSVFVGETVSEADAASDVTYYFGLVDGYGTLIAKAPDAIKVIDL